MLQVCAEYFYDAWGKCLSQTTAASCAVANLADRNPIRYRGYYYDAETGWYYLQSRYYDPIVKRFINADSYATTPTGYTGCNMFAYCNNNPVGKCDPDGECSRFLGFLWKIDCGKATCADSKNYNPTAERVAVIYDNRTSGYIGGLFGGKGFSRQGRCWVSDLETKYAVDEFSFSDMDGFVKSWNSMNGNYKSVFILMHGYAGGLSCAGKTMSNSAKADYDFFSLKRISVNSIYLFSCNGATLSSRNDSVAGNLSYLTGASVWAVCGGSVKYSLFGYIPYSEDGTWSCTRGFTTFTYN